MNQEEKLKRRITQLHDRLTKHQEAIHLHTEQAKKVQTEINELEERRDSHFIRSVLADLKKDGIAIDASAATKEKIISSLKGKTEAENMSAEVTAKENESAQELPPLPKVF